MKLLFLTFTWLFVSGHIAAQSYNKIKFGDVTVKDFATKVYSIDSSADAVIISDIGTSKIEGNSKGSFSLNFKHHKRVHILNKNGYNLSNVSIPLYSNDNGDEELLEKVKAVTYNLEDGKVVETKLDVKTGIFKDKIDKNRIVKKFTFPNVKEGSIIEYEYVINSDFLHNLQPWSYQGNYPRLWSEYNLSLPEFLGYVFLTQGYKQYDVKETKTRFETYVLTDGPMIVTGQRGSISSNVTDYHWVMKNVEALKDETFTTSIDNHIAKIEFQLTELRPPLTYRSLVESWPKVASGLMKAEYFGEQINKDNLWLKDILEPLLKTSTSKQDAARRIFAYVRDNYSCINHSRRTMDQTLKGLIKSKKGNVAEINILLVALLNQADIHADPVLVSTRSNGFVFSGFPLLSQYNYVVARALLDDKYVYLDASESMLGFGRLPLRCYNDAARIISKNAEEIIFSADSVIETKYSTVFMVNDAEGNLVGSMNQTPGYYESLLTRDKIKEKGKAQLESEFARSMGTEVVISNFGIDSLQQYEEVIGIRYDFDLKGEKEDIMYFNPMLGQGYKENLFKSAVRYYPIEMPFAFDQTYNLHMEIPKGYVVDELPKSIVVKLNEDDHGLFEYRVSQSGNNITFRSRVRIARAYFQPDEYEMLREFFNLVVKKQAEQIVFKKKS